MNSALHVLYEDNHLLIINKPSGMLVQGDKTGDVPLVDAAKEYIKKKYKKPGAVFMGLVHRLDRPVSGVVVLARTSKSLDRMNALFRQRETKKVYWAIVDNKPPKPEDSLTHWLKKDEKKNKTTAYKNEQAHSQRAELKYRLLGVKKGLSLIEVIPITGRPHQIRVQLASIRCAIHGDVKYGASGVNADGRIHLHARSLEFIHPVKKELLMVTAPLPDEELWQYFSASDK